MKASLNFEPYVKIRQESQMKYREFDDFRAWMEKEKFSKVTITQSLRGITEYCKTGRSMDMDSLREWRKQLQAEGKLKPQLIRELTNGARRYLTFLTGEEYRFRYPTKPRKPNVCDDDCFHCKYPDCIKPDYLCLSDYK